MDKKSAQKLVKKTFENPFNKERFFIFAKNLLNTFDDKKIFTYKGEFIYKDFSDSVKTLERIGQYQDSNGKVIDILIVRLKKDSTLERARTKQRNYIAKYLNGGRGGRQKDGALVAFIAPNEEDWRFSFVKMEYKFDGKGKVQEVFTPARRHSFLVGSHEKSHTAQSCLLPLLQNDEQNPTLEDLENAFNVEKVTKEFFEKYRELFLKLREALDKIIAKDKKIKADFEKKEISPADFSKKLLGQIVFLYFLQKKGWFGVQKGKKWGTGSKNFLRKLFNQRDDMDRSQGAKSAKNFFNDILEPLFYEALGTEQREDYYSRFNCRIPFLNGGLFDPIGAYDWINTDILLPDELFSNNNKTKEGDTGNGILDIFDRYNFTVKEDEPLEKEVAIDPEMLGKVFENLLEVGDRKSKGTYYTPREIVHYMCQESLINYLTEELKGEVKKEDIETLIRHGESAVEHDMLHQEKKMEGKNQKGRYSSAKLPEAICANASLIDKKLMDIRVCDPAVGSGAFVVGMMNEIVRARNALTPHIRANKNNRSAKSKNIIRSDAKTPYHFKRHAIGRSLYGVDIDSGAIEICKLRLWLSLVVDEEEREKIQPLPNLDYKMVCGNSLLSIEKDLFNQEQFNQLEELKPLYFNETNPGKKQNLKEKIDELINKITKGHKTFDFEIYFSEVFHEKKGFDVVIGNPPFTDSEEMTKSQKQTRQIISQNYALCRGNWPIYIAFFECGFGILNGKKNLVFITPDKWIAKPFGYELRKNKFYNMYSILKAGRKIFMDAKVDAMVSFFSKGNHTNLKVFNFNFKNSKIIFKDEIDKRIIKDTFDFIFSNHLLFLIKLNMFSGKISKTVICENACATSDAYKLKPLIQNISDNVFNPVKHLKIVNTGTVDKYISKWGKKKMTYLGNKYLFPVVNKSAFLKVFNNSYPKKSLKSKIIIKGLTLLDCCLDQEGDIIPGKSTLVITNDDIKKLKYTLAILNSKLPFFYIAEMYQSASYNQGINFTKDMINNFPFPKISDSQKDILTELTDKIIHLIKTDGYSQNSLKQAQVKDTQVKEYKNQIDQLVYKLYNLTPEEIKIVENY